MDLCVRPAPSLVIFENFHKECFVLFEVASVLCKIFGKCTVQARTRITGCASLCGCTFHRLVRYNEDDFPSEYQWHNNRIKYS